MSDNHTSEELAEQDRPLVEQLERMYGARAEDAQSLARIRGRIAQNSVGPLPFPGSALANEQSPVRSGKRQTKETNMRIIYSIGTREKPWQRRLSMIAAAFFIVILVGSLVLLLARRPSGAVAGLQPLQPGWTQVALLSGSSSKTFTHQNILLSTLWGMSFGCVGQGKVVFEFDGQINNQPSTECQLNTESVISAPYGPQSIELATAEHTIQTIQVTVSGSINWFLQFSNAQFTPAPLLATLLEPGSGWQDQVDMGGTGNASSSFIQRGDVTLPNGKTFYIYPKTWGIVVVCSGGGKIRISLDPSVKGIQIATYICNQQPALDVLHFPSPPSFENINVSADSKVIWQIHMLVCFDANTCTKSH